MWIRSQDKESLLNCTGITIMKNIIYGVIDGSERGTGELGRYVSKERAIEILDKIQKEIGNTETAKIIASNSNFTLSEINPNAIIFEMPEE
jgi:hypothetical protein